MQSFLDEGATVHFCSRTQSDVQAANDRHSKSHPGKAFGQALDSSNADQVASWVASCVSQSNRIDAIVANVSALALADSQEAWQSAFNTDMLGTVALVNASLPHLKESKGVVLTISSVSGRIIDFTAAPSPYGPFKAALIHYTAQLAHKHAPDGIRAVTVSPGNIYIEDGIWGDVERKSPEFFKGELAKNPLGRMGKAEEIADVVVFLASGRAGFVSGSNVVVDGALGTGVQF